MVHSQSSFPVRRRLSLLAFLGALGISGADASAKLPAPGGGPEMVVIDMHTHVFNARDLPLAGILRAKRVPPGVAGTIAKLLLTWTQDDLSRDPIALSEVDTSLEETRRIAFSAMTRGIPAAPGTTLLTPLTQDEKEGLIDWVFTPSLNDVPFTPPGAPAPSETPAPPSPLSPESLGLDPNRPPDEQALELVALALQKADFPPSEEGAPPLRRGGEGPPPAPTPGGSPGLKGYLDFLGVMIKGNQTIVRTMQKAYPAVDLFVHHMMDMEKAYDSEPAVAFQDQIPRMNRLDGNFAGHLVHFVAFDPFRGRKEAMDSVDFGIRNGSLGVKFYPPSGYRAGGNDIPDEPGFFSLSRGRWKSRYARLGNDPAARNKELDSRVDEFFTWCENKDLPVFTHCTPGGFEAEAGYGKNADPKYWAMALAKHPKLRLCFGHSGGEAYWFSDPAAPPDKNSFGYQVEQLCLAYENVYCEVGYLDTIFKDQPRKNFLKRLGTVICRESNSTTSTKKWKFGDKIMYGTDWHMIQKEPGHEQFLEVFANLFKDPKLAPWARVFFAGNAIKYLKLEQAAANTAFSPAQREFWKTLVNDATISP